MPLENKTITDLSTLSSTTISDNDLVLFVDLKSNENKNIAASEFAQYNITSSGILSTLVSGSFTGSFTGSLNGLIQSASYAATSSLSLTSSYLFYNGLYNGTASYSINSKESNHSISSSYALSSSYSLTSSFAHTSSYAYLTGSTRSILNTGLSDHSINSKLSDTSSYIKYDGQNNGTVHKSIVSEISNFCLTASNLKNDNTTITARSITSSFAQNALTSSYIISASWSNFSETSSLGSDIVFSYVRFRLQSAETEGKYEIIPESWYNVTNIGMSPNPLTNSETFDIQFDIKYKDYVVTSADVQNFCVHKFKPTVVSNVEFGNLKELQKSNQSGRNTGGLTPYYFNYGGYSCTDIGFVLKFTLVGYDYDNDAFQIINLKSSQSKGKTYASKTVQIANDLLNGAIFTAIVYVDPKGINVNSPMWSASAKGFVNVSTAC